MKKILDLSALPPEVRAGVKSARLRVYFGIQDYSWNSGERIANGLDESFEIVINGQATRYATADPRFPSKAGRVGKLTAGWTDFDIPVEAIRGERLEVVIRKVLPEGKENGDDYIYPGIDNTVPNQSSFMSSDGGVTWTQQQLNTIKAQGEYMVRLVLATRSLHGVFSWSPERVSDPDSFAAYVGVEGQSLRIEPRAGSWDAARAVIIRVAHGNVKPPEIRWLLQDGRKAELEKVSGAMGVSYRLPPDRRAVDALVVEPVSALHRVTVEYEVPTTGSAVVVDLCPQVRKAAGARREGPHAASVSKEQAVLDNGALRAVFRFVPTFHLASLHAAEIDADILAAPDRTHLFRLKVGDRVYGCRDARVVRVEKVGEGFVAVLALDDPRLEVRFSARLVDDELDLGCEIRNTGVEAAQFHLTFPHFAGLQLSADKKDDYYLFPWGGGVIASAETSLRTAYGENTAWWQMVDLFSPPRGGGVYIRAEDPTGLYKAVQLRKGETVHADYTFDGTGRGLLLPEMQWRTALDPVPGVSVCFDYLRRDRPAGGSFVAPSARIGTHAGDWREAMKRYAAWSRTTWPRRPFPSRLTARWTVIPAGWGWQNPLFKDGKYLDDYIVPRWDVPELMSWWTWSDKGPWNTPMDRLEEELGALLFKRYKSYWVNEPVTGKPAYNLNRGDYDGYNPLWGGLPALRAHIEKMKAAGQVPMFYTDPILACANTRIGREHGPKYGLMNPRWGGLYKCGKTPEGYVGSYGSYNMCLDTEWYSEWVAKTMGRVCRETGIDGVRLDEYGHQGYVCESPHHKHIFAEPGHNAWLQALARNCRQVHAEMDKVRPDLVLTTEFPGNDHMSASLDGAIVY
ncbi:MAG: hypothetical protein KAI66_20790, partial [Lentisphaeria bacterium]|nr:hypothetical protein [Lentisphaeria bacterium]